MENWIKNALLLWLQGVKAHRRQVTLNFKFPTRIKRKINHCRRDTLTLSTWLLLRTTMHGRSNFADVIECIFNSNGQLKFPFCSILMWPLHRPQKTMSSRWAVDMFGNSVNRELIKFAHELFRMRYSYRANVTSATAAAKHHFRIPFVQFPFVFFFVSVCVNGF